VTPYLESKLIGTLFGVSYTAPGLWLGLLDAGREVSGANYQRLDIRDKLTKNSPVTNMERFEFQIALSDWGMVDGAAIYDSPKGGNCLWPCELPPQEVTPNRRVVIMPGKLKLSLRKGDIELAVA